MEISRTVKRMLSWYDVPLPSPTVIEEPTAPSSVVDLEPTEPLPSVWKLHSGCRDSTQGGANWSDVAGFTMQPTLAAWRLKASTPNQACVAVS